MKENWELKQKHCFDHTWRVKIQPSPDYTRWTLVLILHRPSVYALPNHSSLSLSLNGFQDIKLFFFYFSYNSVPWVTFKILHCEKIKTKPPTKFSTVLLGCPPSLWVNSCNLILVLFFLQLNAHTNLYF